MLNQLYGLIPEILVIFLALSTQMAAVFFKKMTRNIYSMSLIILLGIILCILLLIIILFAVKWFIVFDSFLFDLAYWKCKLVILSCSLSTLLIYKDFTKIANQSIKVEFLTLILFSTVGVFITLSSLDLMIFFCGLELQSLSGYALAAFNNKSIKSSEAGLKYFILGGLMSCIVLLGMSFIYGFSGSIQFLEIKSVLTSGEASIGLKIGIILVFAGILFKLSVAPFHFWTPDVYEGAPIVSVSYFAVAQKIGMFFVLMMFLHFFYLENITCWLLKIVSILSMIIGSLGVIMQTSLKRLLGYSTILNIGYALIGLAIYKSPNFGMSAVIYIFIYAISVLGVFSCLIALFGAKADDAVLNDLSGIATIRKTIAAAISIFMFSMIGLPPLAGFFGKYYLFYNAIFEGEIMLALIGVITSVIAAFYYLKVVKYMYFVDIPEGKNIAVIPTTHGLMLVSFAAAVFTCLFSLIAYYFMV